MYNIFTAFNQLPSFDLQDFSNQTYCEEILTGENYPALPCYTEDQKKKLECPCLEILIFAYNGNKLNKLSTSVSVSEFQHASGPELK